MTAPLQEQQWNKKLKEETQRLNDQLEEHTKKLDVQLQRVEERTKEMLRMTNRHITGLFHEKMEEALTRLRRQEDERLLHWQHQCEAVRKIQMTEQASILTRQLLGIEGTTHD